MTTENQRSIEQVYRSAVSGLYARLRSNYDSLYRRFGDDGLKLIEEMSREYGISVVIKVNRCPLDFDIPQMCLAHTAMERTVVEELNSNLRYRIGKSIPAGDNCCEHILEIRK